ELLNYMNRTVSLGESNTCILIRPFGYGKTTLVKKAIDLHVIKLVTTRATKG
ncbi:2152_t:CDS:2, partial [Scutellospora calospora]